MRNILLLSLIFFFGVLSAADECDVPIKVKDVEAFYKFIEVESIKVCGKEHCEIKINKTTRDVIIGSNCDQFCSLYNETGIDKMVRECEKIKPEFVAWAKKTFNEKERIFYAYIRLAPDIPCSIMVLDGPSKKIYYSPRTREVFMEGDGKCPWGCGKQKPKETK
ncbi:MAG TPA: hypothetical protein P5077_08130 [bacterium]|nr:hypothetical protein [bacterium]